MTAQLSAVFIAAFLASVVEFVEAFTIVLVVGVTINWRSSLLGALAATGALAVIVGIFGVALVRFINIDALRLAVGILLVLFGLKWLKKAILRYAGLKAYHDEEAIYEEHLAELRARGEAQPARIDTFGVITSFKSVLLEGLEVAFIVITFGSSATLAAGSVFAGFRGQGAGIAVAALGAILALALVAGGGALIHAPLRRVPENTLKFTVGVMLTSFGVFWGGEGLGIIWGGADLFLLALIGMTLLLSGALITWLRQYAPPKTASATRAEREQPITKEVVG